jgi:AcrR family transcriptional regulator
MRQEGAPRTARARVRDELTREIKDVARRHLAEHGSAGLSLRAIARELGMASSAIYRYFPSRDELLTALIVDAYNAVGAAAEAADAQAARDDVLARWLAVTHATRRWAVTQPQQYALIFGSPVPGYAAPQDTIDPAARIPLVLLRILTDARSRGAAPPALPSAAVPLPDAIRQDLLGLEQQLGLGLPEQQLAAAVMAWTQLIGSISFELFGHLNNVIFSYETYFDVQMRRIAADLGLGLESGAGAGSGVRP